MKTATGTTVISNGQLVDGTGAPPVRDAVVVIEAGRIAYAGPAAGAPESDPRAARIDARGGTIMPGLVEAHFHPTYFNVAALEDLDIKYPVEYVTLLAATNAKLALECGYTAARSGGSLFNIDVWLKKAIEEDLVPGPRLAASGREICGVGGLMDWNPDFRKIGMEGLVLLDQRPRRRPPRGPQAGQGRRRVGQDLSDRRRRRARHQRPSHAVHDLRGDARRGRRGAQSRPEGDRPLPRHGRASRTPCAPATTRSSTARSWTTRRSTCCWSATCRWCRPCSSSRPASSMGPSSACRSA